MPVAEELKILIRAEVGKAVRDLESLNKGMGRGRSQMDLMAGAAMRMGGILTGAFSARKLLDVGVAAVQVAADMETAAVSFEVLLGSAEKATALFDEILEFSASTPFQLPELTTAARRLLAFGTASEDVIEKMHNLGNVAQGNSEMLDRLVNAYGKVQAKGRASLEELNLFTEAGVPILKALQDQYGATKKEMFDFISKGKVGFEEVDRALTAMTTGQGQFAGMLEEQAETLNGLFSTLKDVIKLTGAETMQTFVPALKEAAKYSLEILNAWREWNNVTTTSRASLDDVTTLSERQALILEKIVALEITRAGLVSKNILLLRDIGFGWMNYRTVKMMEEITAEQERLVEELERGERFRGQALFFAEDLLEVDELCLEAATLTADEVERQKRVAQAVASIFQEHLAKQQAITEELERQRALMDKPYKAMAADMRYIAQQMHKFAYVDSAVAVKMAEKYRDMLIDEKLLLEGMGHMWKEGSENENQRLALLDQLLAILEGQREAEGSIIKQQDVQITLGVAIVAWRQAAWAETEMDLELMQRLGIATKDVAEKTEEVTEELTRWEQWFEAIDEKLEGAGDILQSLAESGIEMGLGGIADVIYDIGHALGSGADFGDAMADSIRDMARGVLDQLPQMFFSAGIKLILSGRIGLGLLFLGASGIASFAQGFVEGREEAAEAAEAGMKEAWKDAQQAMKDAMQVMEDRIRFEEMWTDRYFDLSHDRIDILRKEYAEALEMAEELGASRAAIDAYYSQMIVEAQIDALETLAQEARRILNERIRDIENEFQNEVYLLRRYLDANVISQEEYAERLAELAAGMEAEIVDITQESEWQRLTDEMGRLADVLEILAAAFGGILAPALGDGTRAGETAGLAGPMPMTMAPAGGGDVYTISVGTLVGSDGMDEFIERLDARRGTLVRRGRVPQ